MSIKQVIVLRTDLNMRKGKMAAQAAHSSMKVFFDRMHEVGDSRFELGPDESWDWPGAVLPWVTGQFTKIVLQCSSEEELLRLRDEAQNLGLPHALIQDSGLTEFHGIPTYTALAVGPAEAVQVDAVTGNLKLL